MLHFLLLKMMLLKFYGILIYIRIAISQQEGLIYVVYIDKNAKMASVIDIAVPADRHVKDKEIEKIDKYQDLCLEIQQLWNMRTIVVPVVVGTLGVVSTHFKHHTKKLDLPNWIILLLQKTALLITLINWNTAIKNKHIRSYTKHHMEWVLIRIFNILRRGS